MKTILDMQVAAKHDKKTMERVKDQKHAQIVHADVAAFEASKHTRKTDHHQSVQAHRESLLNQIDANQVHRKNMRAAMAP